MQPNEKFKILSKMDLFKGLPTIKREWKYKTPMQKWIYVYSFGHAGFGTIGIPLFLDDQTLHWYSYLPFIYVGLYAALAIYTAIYYFILGEVGKFLPCTCLLVGPLFAYMPLVYYLVSKNRYKLHDLIAFGGRNIYRDDRENTEYNRICSKHMDDTLQHIIFDGIFLVTGAVAAEIGPGYAFIFLGIKTTTTEVKVPLAGDKSDAEFIINVILQLIIYLHGVFLYFGIEISMLLFDNVATGVPKLVEHEFMQLDSKIEQRQLTKLQIYRSFKNIVLQSLDLDSYINHVKDYLYWRTLLTPALFTYAIGMAIFCQFKIDFAAGYGLALMSYTQFFFICEVGEHIQNNGFADILYDSNWYGLPIKVQKDLSYLISRQQNGVTLTIGPFGCVNRELYMKITNNIYSFLMFLLNFAA